MNSKSQGSYVARLSKSEQLHEYLLNFENYTPGDETLTTEAISTLITELHAIQNQYIQTQNDYLLATEVRKKSFVKEPDAIGKLLSPIGSYVRGKMGIDSRYYQEISSLIKKIRGVSNSTITKSNSENTISSSERSFGSQLQNFNDIITLIQEFGEAYQPANPLISLETLQALYRVAFENNKKVSKTISLFKPNIDKRQDAYKTLTKVANSVKNMVKSQYGVDSTEYNLVKVLMF